MSSMSPTAADDPLDCLVIGAGPSGLTAATYLTRFHRRIVVVEAGSSRARWIPTSHNFPGYPAGVHGNELLRKLREQATGYGTPIVEGRVMQLARGDDGLFEACAADGQRWRARYVILATGIVDRMPAMHGLEQAIETGTVRLCAVCDGYEASDERIAVYGPVDDAIGHALFLRTFSRDVSVVPFDAAEPDPERAAQARAARVRVYPPACTLRYEHECVVEFEDGREARFDTMYPVLGGDAQSGLAVALGARCVENGELEVDDHQQTSVEGLYAVGDIVSALNQISVGVGHAAIAATAIHNRLPRNFRDDPASQPETAAELPSPTTSLQ